jgi:two-component system chemotaxis response regulator CheY
MPNILVVEDSPTMRQLIGFAIKRIPGSKFIEATDGVDALKKLSSEKVDIILADINMPIMDGLKLVSLVRNNPSYKEIPIIIITTEGAEEDKKKALSIGANAYLTKPIQTQELMRLVNSFIS